MGEVSSNEGRDGFDDQEKGGVEPGEGKSWGRHLVAARKREGLSAGDVGVVIESANMVR